MPITGNSAKSAKAKLAEAKKEWEEGGGVGEYVPATASKADYDRLIAAVNEAARKNESQAALQARIKGLGQGVMAVAKTLGVLA